HVSCVKAVFDPAQADRIAQSARKMFLVAAVRIHFQNAGADVFLFFTGIATAADGNVELAVANRDSAREMPAAVLVTQTVIWKSREHFGLRAWRQFAASVFVTQQVIG